MKIRAFIETKTQVTCMAVVLGVATQAFAQTLPPNLPTKEQLANDNNLFIALAKKALKWEEPAEPAKIVGPIYFVGTKGLGVFLFTTSEGHILMNTGMPSSGPMIVESIRKLGLQARRHQTHDQWPCAYRSCRGVCLPEAAVRRATGGHEG